MSTSIRAGGRSRATAPASGLWAFSSRRLTELAGVGLTLLGLATALALATYNPTDPSLLHATPNAPSNLLGSAGSMVADPLLRLFGVATAIIPLSLVAWGWRLVAGRGVARISFSVLLVLPALAVMAAALARLAPPDAWPLAVGLGGYFGDQFLVRATAWSQVLPRVEPEVAGWIVSLSFTAGSIALLCAATSMGWRTVRAALLFPFRLIWLFVSELLHWMFGGIWEATRRWIGGLRLPRLPRFRLAALRLPRPLEIARFFGERFRALVSWLRDAFRGEESAAMPPLEPVLTAPRPNPATASLPLTPAPRKPVPAPPAKSANPNAGTAKPLVRPKQARPQSDAGYAPPSLGFLQDAGKTGKAWVSKESLQETSEALQSVLSDYGIGGAIRGARPGPAVTLYEFDPPPGMKAAKIESLSDDIARSMGVASARIATIPGSKMIGIEIPNQDRQSVFLSELLASPKYAAKGSYLPLALGKNILGEAIVADLEKMPHLLVAGTTGSGKSVAINAMILSLLYRHGPENCRMILIDPKMLEFSVYDDIPHLLTPVVTDPKQAVAALQWVVQEMAERYRLMSHAGVRNITSFNSRAAQARKSGKPMTATISAGIDPETGAPVDRVIELESRHMPRIVVVVDEMADLMMVAGKDIEACVQRLAQMARASGIHLIMATQRPSVDVITGTIKANLPVRISFRLSSKIDSRTILNEQGAEKLLGQGDMLYQSAGSQVARIHGPFVSEEEIGQVVSYLKSLGPPEYVADVTLIDEEQTSLPGMPDATSDDELYNRAVETVLRDKRASTSYLQRRLEIGYNRAARLMDQLEEAGIVGPANAVGRREILAA